MLKPIYQHLDAHFECDFEKFKAEVEQVSDKEAYIMDKMKSSLEIMDKLGPIFGQNFNKDMKGFFHRIFRADSKVFQFFELTVFSAYLEKFGIHE